MLTKIFPTGQGNGYGPVDYLCSTNPFGRGARSQAPKVLGGNPSLIMRQIDAIPFKHKYTSGVHSFAPEDAPTDDQIREVMDATEELAFAGLPLSSRSILWVKHEHAGRRELHFLIPRQEVNTGKSFNAFPPGWQKKYDHLRDKFNYKYGWARPDDPGRARHWQPGINAKILADAKRRNVPNPKSEVFSLTDDLANMAIQGKLANRIEIVSELRRRGYGISRQGKDYITIVDSETGKRTRLKGTLFEENFNGPEWIKIEIAKFNKPASEQNLVDLELAAKADAELREAIHKNELYNCERYGLKEIQNGESTEKSPTDPKAAIEPGREEEKMGLGTANSQRTVAAIKKSPDRKKDDSNALYPEQGLGANGTYAGTGKTGNEVHAALREIPLPEQSFSGMGGGAGERPPLERGNRETSEQLHGGSDPASYDSIGTGTRDHRWQSKKPGRDDGAYSGHVERIARQSGWPGEFRQRIQSLRKSSEKLEKRLLAHNQPSQKAPDFMLDLYPGLADFRAAANQAVSDLHAVHEINLLRNVSRCIDNGCIIRTTPLKAEAEKAVNSLIGVAGYRNLEKINRHLSANRNISIHPLALEAKKVCNLLGTVYEQKLLQELANFALKLNIPSSNNLSFQANNLVKNLELAYESKIVSFISRSLCLYKLPDVSSLKITAGNLSRELVKLADFRILKNLDNFAQPVSIPNLTPLAESASRLQYSLKSAHETRFISSIFHAEQKREKRVADCWRFAKWAGDDLRKWEKVFDKFEKYPKKLKILENMIDLAHSKFALILSDTQNLAEIRERCGDDPFLQREYGILLENVDQYYAEKREQEVGQECVDNPDSENRETQNAYSPNLRL